MVLLPVAWRPQLQRSCVSGQPLLPCPSLLPWCCRSGDRVIVTSRSLAGAQRAAEQLREEVGPGIDITGGCWCVYGCEGGQQPQTTDSPVYATGALH